MAAFAISFRTLLFVACWHISLVVLWNRPCCCGVETASWIRDDVSGVDKFKGFVGLKKVSVFEKSTRGESKFLALDEERKNRRENKRVASTSPPAVPSPCPVPPCPAHHLYPPLSAPPSRPHVPTRTPPHKNFQHHTAPHQLHHTHYPAKKTKE